MEFFIVILSHFYREKNTIKCICVCEYMYMAAYFQGNIDVYRWVNTFKSLLNVLLFTLYQLEKNKHIKKSDVMRYRLGRVVSFSLIFFSSHIQYYSETFNLNGQKKTTKISHSRTLSMRLAYTMCSNAPSIEYIKNISCITWFQRRLDITLSWI